ncbi:Hsp70 family protein [Virgisporangium aurantiacum]|uniref:LCCL domain-containing protein n=1 Tax=Virgisporangium aurantiacum TaxID=175570 RepID=A0A8J3Z7Y1_9ACTN|nr:Hsp70 family protein [Virgisporangium aurantiacum]GIJ58008.1 hypothetical protein Vau01_055240 [Virgisporangium aurantiacum]
MNAPGYRLGIDFGTSNTVAMLAWPDGQVRPLLFDGSPALPSAVYADASSGLLIGRDAAHAARVSPERYEPNPKRRIDEPAVLLGDVEVSTVDLIAAVLGRVTTEARRVAGGSVGGGPVAATITFPAAWAQTRRGILVAAAERAGLGPVTLVPEPVAAASVFVGLNSLSAGAFVVYDLGAGTFDATVVRRTPNGGFDVLATEGLPQSGGLDIDAAIVGYLGAVYSTRDPNLWARLLRPTTSAERRANRLLWEDVRSAKEMLSRSASTMIHIPMADEDAPLGRDQFEQLARPILDATVTATRAAIAAAGLPAGGLGGVFLVGGGSRIPLVATLLHQAFGVAPTVVEQPELVVAQGSLGAAAATPPPSGGPASAPVSGGFPAPVSAAPVSGGFANPASPVSGGFANPASPVSGGFANPASPVSGGFTNPASPVSGTASASMPVSGVPAAGPYPPAFGPAGQVSAPPGSVYGAASVSAPPGAVSGPPASGPPGLASGPPAPASGPPASGQAGFASGPASGPPGFGSGPPASGPPGPGSGPAGFASGPPGAVYGGGPAPGRASVPAGHPGAGHSGAGHPGAGGGRPAGRSPKVGILVAVAVVAALVLGIGGYAIAQLTNDDGKKTAQNGGDTGGGETTDSGSGSDSGSDSGGTNSGGGAERPASADFYHDDADWSTTAEEHNDDIGKTVAYKCPAGGSPNTVWGSEPFTSDSSVCTAAVHAGWISLADGGWVKLQMQAGVDSYQGTEQYGISTTDYGPFRWAFSFTG